MSISIYTKENQADGNFNYGEILEKKPIGFPQDGGKLKPYSNLFYLFPFSTLKDILSL